jgi:hypothetical protein
MESNPPGLHRPEAHRASVRGPHNCAPLVAPGRRECCPRCLCHHRRHSSRRTIDRPPGYVDLRSQPLSTANCASTCRSPSIRVDAHGG